MGMSQGGVLSPILFNIYTSRLIDILPLGIRYAMYADDLFLYARSRAVSAARNTLSVALGLVIPWLRALGFEISIAKCQFSVFTRSRGNRSDLALSVEGHELPCLSEMKYLGVILGHRLTRARHVRMILERAIRLFNINRVLARVSWRVNPSLLLVAYLFGESWDSSVPRPCAVYDTPGRSGVHAVYLHLYPSLRIWGVPPRA